MDSKKKDKKKTEFMEYLLGIIFLLLFFAVFLVILYFIFKLAVIGISAIQTIFIELGKLDAVIIVALVSGCFSILITFLNTIGTSISNQRNSRKEYLAQKREEPYGEYIEMVYKVAQNSNGVKAYTEEDMIKDITKFSRGISLWGSKRVAKKWSKFRVNSMNPQKTKDNLFLMEEIMNDMRRDIGTERTKKGDLLGFFINDINDIK